MINQCVLPIKTLEILKNSMNYCEQAKDLTEKYLHKFNSSIRNKKLISDKAFLKIAEVKDNIATSFC